MDVPFAKRGKRMDECIEIIRGLTTGEYFEFHGEFYDIPKKTKMTPPAPTEPIPILIGGHADAALKRAARNDGWMHGGGSPEELDLLLKRLKQIREEEGRTGPFEIHVISADATASTASNASRTWVSPTSSSDSGSRTSPVPTPNRSTPRSGTSRNSPST